MLTPEQKNAIENLLILVDYVKDNSVYSDKDAEIIDKSIRVAETLIGRKRESYEDYESEIAKSLAEEIKKKFDA